MVEKIERNFVAGAIAYHTIKVSGRLDLASKFNEVFDGIATCMFEGALIYREFKEKSCLKMGCQLSHVCAQKK